MSPASSSKKAYVLRVHTDGRIAAENILTDRYARPVINLKPTIEITKGDGTQNNPYVIKTN